MRTIERSSGFKRDYKREARGRHRSKLDEALKLVLVHWRPMSPSMRVTTIMTFPVIGLATANVM